MLRIVPVRDPVPVAGKRITGKRHAPAVAPCIEVGPVVPAALDIQLGQGQQSFAPGIRGQGFAGQLAYQLPRCRNLIRRRLSRAGVEGVLTRSTHAAESWSTHSPHHMY